MNRLLKRTLALREGRKGISKKRTKTNRILNFVNVLWGGGWDPLKRTKENKERGVKSEQLWANVFFEFHLMLDNNSCPIVCFHHRKIYNDKESFELFERCFLGNTAWLHPSYSEGIRQLAGVMPSFILRIQQLSGVVRSESCNGRIDRCIGQVTTLSGIF